MNKLITTLIACALAQGDRCGAQDSSAMEKPAASAASSIPEFFPTDSRRWSRASDAVVMADLAKAEPASALVTGKREKGKWKVIPFTTAGMKGSALPCYSGTGAAVVPQRAVGMRCMWVWRRLRADSTSAAMG